MATGIEQLYRDVLGRAPDAGGLDYWSRMFGPTIEPEEVATFKAAAAPELQTQSQIKGIYQDVLGRAPEAEGMNYWLSQFGPGALSQTEIDTLKQAAQPEVQAQKTVEKLYTDYLQRPSDKEGLQYWVKQFGTDISPEEITAFKTAANQELQSLGKPLIPGTTPGTLTGTQTGVTTTPIDPSQSTLSPNFADYVYRMLAKGEQVANLPYQPYTGQRYAGVSPLQLQAFSGIANLADPAAFAEAQRFMTMAGTNAGNTFYTPTSFTTGLSPASAGTTAPMGGASLPVGGAARNVNLPTVEEVVSRFGATPGWNTQTPSTAIPTGQTLEGRFPEAEQTFADGGLASLATPQQNPFQLGDVASYMSPYMTNVMDIEAREARRQADIGRTAEQARLAQAGAYGGSRQAIMEAERQRNLQTQMGDIATKGLQSAYDRAMEQRLKESGLGLEAQKLGEQSRQFGATFGLKGQELGLQAGQALGQLGAQQGQFGLDALKTMLGAGQTQQQLAQQPYDFGYQQWQESMQYPYQQATFMSRLLGGLPLSAAPYSTGTSGLNSAIQGLLLGSALIGGLK